MLGFYPVMGGAYAYSVWRCIRRCMGSGRLGFQTILLTETFDGESDMDIFEDSQQR